MVLKYHVDSAFIASFLKHITFVFSKTKLWQGAIPEHMWQSTALPTSHCLSCFLQLHCLITHLEVQEHTAFTNSLQHIAT